MMAQELGWSIETEGLLLSALPVGYILGNLPGGILTSRGFGPHLLPSVVGLWSLLVMAAPDALQGGKELIVLIRFL